MHLPPGQAALLPNSQLQTNAFFDFASTNFTGDLALYGSLGNAYAFTYRNRILSDAIPALSLPIGANPVGRLQASGRNFDMQASFENGWPTGRGTQKAGATAPGEWHHSDFREVAYSFTYQLFNEIVNQANLK